MYMVSHKLIKSVNSVQSFCSTEGFSEKIYFIKFLILVEGIHTEISANHEESKIYPIVMAKTFL